MLKTFKPFLPTSRYFLKGQYYSLKYQQNIPRDLRNKMMCDWAHKTLKSLNVEYSTLGKAPESSCLMVGNHMSYLDIPLLMAPNAVLFIAKKEISKWPIFGRAAKAIDMIFVDRTNMKSRKDSIQQLAQKIIHEKERVVVFPAGTTSIDEDIKWHQGTFKFAQRNNILIQPFRLSYSPIRKAAYIDKDILFPHVNKLVKHKIYAKLEYGEPQYIKDLDKDFQRIKDWCRPQYIKF